MICRFRISHCVRYWHKADIVVHPAVAKVSSRAGLKIEFRGLGRLDVLLF